MEEIQTAAAIITITAGACAWWYWGKDRELRRIYRRAAKKVSVNNPSLRQSLEAAISNVDFWNLTVLPDSVSLAREKEALRGILRRQTTGVLSAESEAAVERFYEAVYNGLGAAKNSHWQTRKNEWRPEIAPPAQQARLGAGDVNGTETARWVLPDSNLPGPDAETIGREAEIAGARDRILRDGVRLLTFTGGPGFGKTHLCLEVAKGLKNDFGGRVFFADLTPLKDCTRVLSTIAQTLGIEEGDDASLLKTVRGRLREERLLLVVDNFEHVIEGASCIKDLLAACPEMRMLATSREPLDIRFEKPLNLSPLPVPASHSASVNSLLQNAAVQLFVERATEADGTFALTDGNGETVSKICAGLDGVPLSIELTAAHIGVFNPQELLAELPFQLDFLTDGARDLPERQRSLRNTIAWSYDLLKTGEQQLFQRLSVFVGGWTLESAVEVCNTPGGPEAAVRRGVESLLKKNLLTKGKSPNGETRFSMLDMIYMYGQERLTEGGDRGATEEKHALYFLTLAEAAEPNFRGADPEMRVMRLKAEQDNLRAALRWSLAHENAETALRLALVLRAFWDMQGQRIEARGALASALKLVLDEGKDAPAELQIRALDEAALLAVKQGDCARIRKYAEKMLSLSRETGSQIDVAEALHRLARAMYLECNFEEAHRLLEDILTQYQNLGHRPERLADIRFDLGNIALDEGDLLLARENFDESLKLIGGDGKKNDRGRFHTYMGFVLYKLGEHDAAREHMAKAREVLEGEKYIRWHLHFAARLDGLRGDLTSAREGFRQSLEIFSRREDYDELGIIRSLLGLSWVSAKEGDVGEAVKLLGAEEALRATMNLPLPPPDWKAEMDFILEESRKRMDEAAVAGAWAEGRTMSWEQASTTR